MIKCPKCHIPYKKNVPDKCRFCGTNLIGIKEINEEQKDDLLIDFKCVMCGSSDLKLTFHENLVDADIICNNCKFVDTREFIDSKFSNRQKCDLCGSETTEISQDKNGLRRAVWNYTEFNYINIKILCEKCNTEHIDELEEKEEKTKYEIPIIEYVFDGDALKYWRKGDNGVDFEEIEIDNDDGKQRYKKAITKMKKKFPKNAKFIDIDEL